jgi:hypothetical protein
MHSFAENHSQNLVFQMQTTVRNFPLALLALALLSSSLLVAQEAAPAPQREIAVDLLALRNGYGISVLYRKGIPAQKTLRMGATLNGSLYRRTVSPWSGNPDAYGRIFALASVGIQKNFQKGKSILYRGADLGLCYEFTSSSSKNINTAFNPQGVNTTFESSSLQQTHVTGLFLRPFVGATLPITKRFILGAEAAVSVTTSLVNFYSVNRNLQTNADTGDLVQDLSQQRSYSEFQFDLIGPTLSLWLGVRLN